MAHTEKITGSREIQTVMDLRNEFVLNSLFIHSLPMAKTTPTPKKSSGTPITIAGTGPIPVTKKQMKIPKNLPKNLLKK